MSFLFGGDKPQAAPVPASPMADEEAARQRQAAADAALAERAQSGRRQTIVGGMKVAEEEQQGTGLLSARKRAASRALMG